MHPLQVMFVMTKMCCIICRWHTFQLLLFADSSILTVVNQQHLQTLFIHQEVSDHCSRNNANCRPEQRTCGSARPKLRFISCRAAYMGQKIRFEQENSLLQRNAQCV